MRVLDGNASHSSKPNPDEPQPTGDLAEPPPGISAREVAIWRYAIGNAPAGMLKLIDHSVFSVWVRAMATFEEAREKVSSLGLLVKTKSGEPMQNPYLSIQNKQAAIIMKAASELGFSPTARPRVKIEKPAKSDSPFGDLKSLTD